MEVKLLGSEDVLWVSWELPAGALLSLSLLNPVKWRPERLFSILIGSERKGSSSAWSEFTSRVSAMCIRSACGPGRSGSDSRVLSWSLTSARTLHFSRMRISGGHITEVATALGWWWWSLTALPQQPLVWNLYQSGAVTFSRSPCRALDCLYFSPAEWSLNESLKW